MVSNQHFDIGYKPPSGVAPGPEVQVTAGAVLSRREVIFFWREMLQFNFLSKAYSMAARKPHGEKITLNPGAQFQAQIDRLFADNRTPESLHDFVHVYGIMRISAVLLEANPLSVKYF